MSHHAVALPRPTLPEDTQRAFWSFDYKERSEIINDMASFIQSRIQNKYIRKQEQERCETLIKLGASNTMILHLLATIEHEDIRKIRDYLQVQAQTGRIEQAKTEDIPQINKSWRELLEQHVGQKDEFECWLILADVFPEYTLGQLFNAVRYGEVS
ncbi:MAG: DUF2857 family protein [Neisseriaceae bacterium]|nr:DUF2857 family protein [Neisseriaceae bacterium]MBR5674860.1 DUF2857 family protein [Neisseriaceae bacterium]